MTERTHIQRYYRQRFAELHTRKLRVNSHRKQMGDWRLRWSYDPASASDTFEWFLNGVRVDSFSRKVEILPSVNFPDGESLGVVFGVKQ